MKSLSRSDLAIFLVLGGLWLHFDLTSTMSTHLATYEWVFYFPFFSYAVDAHYWTLVPDIAIVMVLVGWIITREDHGGPITHQSLSAFVKAFQSETVLLLGAVISLSVLAFALMIALDPLRYILG